MVQKRKPNFWEEDEGKDRFTALGNSKVLFSFTVGVYLFGDFLIRLVIMQTRVWVTDAIWLPETVLTFGLSAISFAWFTYSLAQLVKKLHSRG
jgi:uncharacterized membrane protein YfhO